MHEKSQLATPPDSAPSRTRSSLPCLVKIARWLSLFTLLFLVAGWSTENAEFYSLFWERLLGVLNLNRTSFWVPAIGQVTILTWIAWWLCTRDDVTPRCLIYLLIAYLGIWLFAFAIIDVFRAFDESLNGYQYVFFFFVEPMILGSPLLAPFIALFYDTVIAPHS